MCIVKNKVFTSRAFITSWSCVTPSMISCPFIGLITHVSEHGLAEGIPKALDAVSRSLWELDLHT